MNFTAILIRNENNRLSPSQIMAPITIATTEKELVLIHNGFHYTIDKTMDKALLEI